MIEETARALSRRLSSETDPGTVAGIRAALATGGYDPETIEPDTPQGYIQLSLSNARAYDPAYLSDNELSAMIEAADAARGGNPF